MCAHYTGGGEGLPCCGDSALVQGHATCTLNGVHQRFQNILELNFVAKVARGSLACAPCLMAARVCCLQMSIDAMLNQCASAEQINATRTNALFFKDMAAKFGLPLATYEGGPSIMEGSVIFNGGGTPGAADKYIALQRDPRFKGIYESYLTMFEHLGMVSEAAPYMQFVSAGLPSK